MSTESVRRVSRQEIQLVQNLIERCLQLYMNRKEVVDTLLEQAKIEPGFTELVWQKLEEENQEFFKAYYLRLLVKHQIIEFNKLLEQQVRLMSQMHSAGVAPIPTTNGTHISESVHQNTTCYNGEPPEVALKTETETEMHHQVGSSIPNLFTNGGSSLHTSMHAAVDISRIGPSTMISAHNSNVTLMSGMNGGMIKPEPGYSGNSSYMFGADGGVLETRTTIGDACSGSFPVAAPDSQSLNESLMDPDATQFGYLTHIPRTFSLSDLTADFSQSSGILESYPRSPFLAPYNENFEESRGREQGEHKTLDSISEGLSYEDFGSK